jgi:hypothetical protein
MRNDEAKRAPVFSAERLTIMFESKEHIRTQEIVEGDVGGIAFLGEDEDKFRSRLAFYVLQDIAEENALPAIVEAAPAGDTMEVAGDFDLRESAKLLPGETQRFLDEAGDFEIPIGGVEIRDATIVEHGPLEGE